MKSIQMHEISGRLTVILAASAIISSAVEGQSRLTISPANPAPGAIVRLTLVNSGATGDSTVGITGRMSGEELHFRKASDNTWRAVAPIKVDAVGDVVAEVVVERSSGVVDSVNAIATLPKPIPAKSRGRSRAPALAVPQLFTRPMSAETQARIERENATARELGRKAHATPPMWTASFLRPRDATITSRFGTGRIFNGTLSSRHLGVDFRGVTGSPVVAANRGIVALVDAFFLAGNVVYIDHGGGIVTAYFHLSKTLVATGDTVERGQEIGLVGATGRVTGPHLHWSARYGQVTVNPLDLLTAANP
ncbi:MAG: M23 family metallopeptidase [Gemmatimonadaceae bacterium]